MPYLVFGIQDSIHAEKNTKMRIKEVLSYLESVCPPAYQESYDNCGLITGDSEQEIKGVLLCLDSTEDVIKEAIKNKCNLVIAHHPILFSPIKKITGKTYSERVIISAIKHDICIYAMHTNLDNIHTGVNNKIAEKLGLKNLAILSPKKGVLRKLVTFCPRDKADLVRAAIFNAGAGVIGDYDECSFNATGYGTFTAGESSNPHVGKIGELHREEEVRIETIFPNYLLNTIIKALNAAHPYEEVAYDIYPIENNNPMTGAGMIGKLKEPMDEIAFLESLKSLMNTNCIRHTKTLGKKIETIAVCGGAGSFLLKEAMIIMNK